MSAANLFRQIAENSRKLKINIEQCQRSGYNKCKTFCHYLWYFKGGRVMFIPPKSDVSIKELFQNEMVLRHFISAVLAIRPEDIRTIRLKNTFLRRRYRKQKQGILDILAEMNDHSKINIELQVKHYAYWDRRQLFYLSKLYTEDMRIGEDYALLKKCVSISILDFNLTNRNEYHHAYRLRDKHGYEFSDMLEIHTLELKKKLKETAEMDELEEWIRFFQADCEEDLDMIKTKNPGILEAIKEVKEMSLSRRMRIRYEAHLKQVRDEKAWKTYERAEARKEGLAEGRTEGLAEGRSQIIRNMINQKVPDEDIIRLSGCSEKELQEIKG